jgi:hypothetical protein
MRTEPANSAREWLGLVSLPLVDVVTCSTKTLQKEKI